MYDRDELETLRWNYRMDQLEEFKLSEEELRYFVAVKEADEAGLPPPPLPPSLSDEPEQKRAEAEAAQAPQEYARKSQVDMALVDKYLDRHITRDSTAEMAKIYKEAFGEDMHVPEKLSLVDLTYGTGSIGQAHKVTKTDIFGTPEEIAAEKAAAEKKEAKVEAAPKKAKSGRTRAFVTAYKRGVPEGPSYDAKWSVWNPFRFWVIPRRFAGKSAGRYYLLAIINAVIFIGQFVLLLVPFAIRAIVTALRWVWRRFLRNRVSPGWQRVKERAAQAAAVPPEGEKKEGQSS